MRNVRRDAMTILLLLVSGFGCATFPRNAGPPPVEGGPGETLKRLSALMQAPKVSRPAGVPAKAIPAPSSRGESGAGTYFINLLTKMETPQRGPVASPKPPPAVPSTPPPATAVALLPPPAKSEEVAQPPPPTVLPLPQEEEARTREPTPSQASGMETAAPTPAPLAAVDPSKGGSVASPEPPPEVPSTPSATAVALLPPPAKSEEVAQPPPPTVLPLPQEEEARTREPTPSNASGMETAAPALAPLAAVDPSKAGSVASPEPPPEVPSTPSATDPLRLEEERLSVTKSYRIGPEDVLHVFVWNNPELTIDVTVRPDGKISLPLIKDIQAADFTPVELSDVIFRNLKEYIYYPHVTVTVTQTNSRKVFLIGNVIRPGSYMLRHDMTVLQALSLAGGFTTFASPRDMKLIRDAGGKQESRSINYYKMIKDAEVDDYLLKPGDTIVIP